MANRIRRPHPFRAETMHANVARDLVVRSNEQLADRYRRIVLGGAQLAAFVDSAGVLHPPVSSTGFDDVAVLFFPAADGTIARPQTFADGRLLPDEAALILPREYTVRAFDLAANELVIDLIMHDSGVATDWARAAMPGDPLVVVAPRVSRAVPTSRAFVAIGDATALPALGRLSDMQAEAYMIAAIDDDLAVMAPGGARVVAPTSAAVISELEAMFTTLSGAVADATFWIAGESSLVTDVRRHLVRERGVARESVQFTGYWRLGATGLLEHAPDAD